jgi:dTDP-4-dehydrorhamnose reductase
VYWRGCWSCRVAPETTRPLDPSSSGLLWRMQLSTRNFAKNRKIAIIGANGQLGSDLCRVLAEQEITAVPLTRNDVDVANVEQVNDVLGSIQPDVVVNTAAFHKVEQCEEEPAAAFAVNAIGVRNVALSCSRTNALLVHFSTDYVFGAGGPQPRNEDDLPHPLNVYGASKLAGEAMVAFTWERNFVIRTCGLYGLAGSKGKGGNFVETMLQKVRRHEPIHVVDDQVLTPTFTGDLADAVIKLIRTEAYGLYHISAEGQCSWFDFAREIFRQSNIHADLAPMSTQQLATPVQRPSYSVLSKKKLNSIGIGMPQWENGLRRYLDLKAAAASAPASSS